MAGRTATPGTYVALLRGINVGGKNKLPMKDLVAMFIDAGCSDVRSYIQSGNVVFRAASSVARSVPAQVAASIASRFALQVPVVQRTAAELRVASSSNPFLLAGADPNALHALFLAESPTAEAVASLDPNRSPPDVFALVGNTVFLHLPNGVARTKLTNAYFDKKLATISTGRNWRTVLALVSMCEDHEREKA